MNSNVKFNKDNNENEVQILPANYPKPLNLP